MGRGGYARPNWKSRRTAWSHLPTCVPAAGLKLHHEQMAQFKEKAFLQFSRKEWLTSNSTQKLTDCQICLLPLGHLSHRISGPVRAKSLLSPSARFFLRRELRVEEISSSRLKVTGRLWDCVLRVWIGLQPSPRRLSLDIVINLFEPHWWVPF